MIISQLILNNWKNFRHINVTLGDRNRQWDRDLSGDEVRGTHTETKCNRNLSYLASRILNTPTIDTFKKTGNSGGLRTASA